MRTILLFLFYIALVLVAGALLSVPLYSLAQPLLELPFHKWIGRVTLACGLVAVFLHLGLSRQLNPETAGFAVNRCSYRLEIVKSALAGIAIMLVLEALLLGLDIHRFELYFDTALPSIVIVVIKAIVTGVVVGLLEETLFRGALLGGLLKKVNAVPAVIFSSAVYSAAHFLKYRPLPEDAGIRWHTGIEMLPEALSRFGNPSNLDMFLALFAFGVLLALVRLEQGNIFRCIGLHAGVVAAIKLINYTTDYAPGARLGFLVNEYDHMLGYLALVLLSVIIFIYYRFLYKRRVPG